MKILIFVIMGFMLLTNNCKKDKKDDVLSITRTPYAGTVLSVNGYYYNEYITDYITVYFFYRDGTILYGNSLLNSDLANQEIEYKNGIFYNFAKEIKYYWGVFKIEGNKISFERWYPSEPPYKAFVSAGIILNDTTFNITEIYRMQDGKKTEEKTLNETYYFKQLSPKPDSTNSFVQ